MDPLFSLVAMSKKSLRRTKGCLCIESRFHGTLCSDMLFDLENTLLVHARDGYGAGQSAKLAARYLKIDITYFNVFESVFSDHNIPYSFDNNSFEYFELDSEHSS